MEIGYYEKLNENRIKQTADISKLPEIKGMNHEKDFTIKRLIESLEGTGLQASNLAEAIKIIKEMREDKAKIFLGFTSNMISSGVRESIKYLVKNKLVDVVVTAVGGIEEDLLKIIESFRLGSFEAPGKMMYDTGINRIGNIFVTNNHYAKFELKIRPFLEDFYARNKGRTPNVYELTKELGLFINHEDSFLYWAAKNNIPVFCPVITDGALGDMIYFLKKKHKDFAIDISGDMAAIVDETLDADKTGTIILGGGAVKHHIMNAQLFREGADYAVYVNTGEAFDGSDSGGNFQEAMSWGKINPSTRFAKVHADASLVFALIVEAAFKN